MSEWEDAPTPVTKSTVSSEWETAPIPETTSRADLIPDTPKQPIYKEPTLGEKVIGLGEVASMVGTGLFAFPAGLASGAAHIVLGKEKGPRAAEEVAGKVMERYTYVPRTEAGKEYGHDVETVFRESGIMGALPGMIPHVPSLGKGAIPFVKEKLGISKGTKTEGIPAVETPVTPEITPEVPVRSTVDTTLEQWQTELAVEQTKPETIRPLEQSVISLEGVKPIEDISTPQEGVMEGLKPSVEGKYIPREEVDTRTDLEKELGLPAWEEAEKQYQETQRKEGKVKVTRVTEDPTQALENIDLATKRHIEDIVFEAQNRLEEGDIKGHQELLNQLSKVQKEYLEMRQKVSREKIPSITDTPGKTPLATEVTTITKGIITEADGTPAVTDAGTPRIARRNKETGEIELNPDAAKASWEASTPENKPWIKDTFDTPEKYEEFIIKHEQEHALSPQKEGETTLEYEKRITKQALEKVGIVREEPKVLKEGKLPSIYDVVDEADFHIKGKQVLKEQGPEVARKFIEDYRVYRKDNYVEIPKTNLTDPMNSHPMADALYQIDSLHKKDEAELRNLIQEEPTGLIDRGITSAVGGERPKTLAEQGITKEVREKWSKALDGDIKLSPEEQAIMDHHLNPMREEAEALARKTGEPLVEGYQPRIRLWTPKSLKETFGRWWEDMTRTEGAFAQKMAETPDALMERNVYALERPNGTRTVIQIRKDGIYQFKNGKMSVLVKGSTNAKKVGDTLGTDGVIKEAKISEIETHTDYRYSKDPVLNWKIRLNELRKLDREQTFLRELVAHPTFKDIGIDVLNKETGKPNELPKGWKIPKHLDRIPQLAGKAFEPKIAYIIEDWAKAWDKSLMQNLTSFLIKNMMLNPLPHVFNEAMHLYNIRGATGWFTPGGLYRFIPTARAGMRDVLNQSPLYLQVMKEGGSILGADPRNKQFVRDILAKAGKDAMNDPNFQKDLTSIAAKVGMSPLNLYNRWSQASTKFMWVTRDMMYMQIIRETMKRRGVDVKGAIKIVEKHMPNYRLPSEVMGSRKVSEVLGNPNIAVFSRYHYGMVRSILETLKEANPKNLKTPEGRQQFLHSADVLAAVGIAYAGLYPVMDKIAEEMFGMKAEQRRAGPYHLIHAVKEVSEGKKDVQTALAPVFTFNPVLLYAGQLALNRQVYSGKEVYHPNDSAEMILSDVGTYTLKTVPQYGPMQQAEESPEGLKKFVAKQMDIKAKTREEVRKHDVRSKYVEAARKRREKAYRLGKD